MSALSCDSRHGILPGSARVVRFGEQCGAGAGWTMFEGGRPNIGNARFSLRGSGATANTPVHLGLGLSDQQFGPLPLPFTLPGGCGLLVSMESLTTTTADGSGFMGSTVPIPNTVSLIGAVFYGQWAQVQPRLAMSNAVAIFVGV